MSLCPRYPTATAATRNRQVYTPVSAVLKRAEIERQIKRPKGWRGRKLTHWLAPEQALRVFEATARIDAPGETRLKFRIYLRMLCSPRCNHRLESKERMSQRLELATTNPHKPRDHEAPTQTPPPRPPAGADRARPAALRNRLLVGVHQDGARQVRRRPTRPAGNQKRPNHS
jgi:hypothetical protein